MTPSAWLTVLSGAVFLAAWAGTWAALPWLARARTAGSLGDRSDHARSTPAGGGIVPVAAVCLAWLAAGQIPGVGMDAVAAAIVSGLGAALALLSWAANRRGLPAATRVVARVLAVAVGLLTLPGPVFQGWLPLWVDLALAGLLWAWFVDVFDGMDGTDGIATTEAVAIGAGTALVATLSLVPFAPVVLGMTAAAGAAGFLLWNWPPARVLLGGAGAGAVPFGFLLGWLLLALAAGGQWVAALLLPLVFVADAAVTLARRAVRGESPWRSHRAHFTLRLAAAVGDHARIVRRVAVADAGLIALAVVAAARPALALAALAAGVVVTAVLLRALARAASSPRSS